MNWLTSPPNGFGAHSSLWMPEWDAGKADRALREASDYGLEFIEIGLQNLDTIDVVETRRLFEKHRLRVVCSLGLPAEARPTVDVEAATGFLRKALDTTVAIGGEALSGVIYGSIGERTGSPPSEAEYDAVVEVLAPVATYAKTLGLMLGIEAVNRYENHLINTSAQAGRLIQRIGNDNVFIHLDTYHLNIEENVADGIASAGAALGYIHMSESDRGVPGAGNINWDAVCAALKRNNFRGALALESFVEMPPSHRSSLALWRPVATSRQRVLEDGLSFLTALCDKHQLFRDA